MTLYGARKAQLSTFVKAEDQRPKPIVVLRQKLKRDPRMRIESFDSAFNLTAAAILRVASRFSRNLSMNPCSRQSW